MTRVIGTLVACLATGTAFGATTSDTVDVGEYTSQSIVGPYTGLMTSYGGNIGGFDNPAVFDQPYHTQADYLWFTSGAMAWDFALSLPTEPAIIDSVSFTVEIGSEYPGGTEYWPSPVTFSLGGTDVGTWTIPGDPNYLSYGFYRYGYQEFHHSWQNSQYGWLVTITVDAEGTWLEYAFRAGDQAPVLLSDVTLADIALTDTFPVGIDVLTVGGINIFGDNWGDYDTDLTVDVEYRTVGSECGEEDPRNHGQYESCVVHFAQDLRAAGVIDQAGYTALVTTAAHSPIGKK